MVLLVYGLEGWQVGRDAEKLIIRELKGAQNTNATENKFRIVNIHR